MAMDPVMLASLANDYAKGMTSIRGRRVQRLLKREFAGAEHVSTLARANAEAAVLGVSASGAALCATDGRGKHACVVKWLHGSTEGIETRFDLLKDSLPVLGTKPVRIADLRGEDYRSSRPDSVPAHLRSYVGAALEALTGSGIDVLGESQ